jgi:hypothetical protein
MLMNAKRGIALRPDELRLACRAFAASRRRHSVPFENDDCQRCWSSSFFREVLTMSSGPAQIVGSRAASFEVGVPDRDGIAEETKVVSQPQPQALVPSALLSGLPAKRQLVGGDAKAGEAPYARQIPLGDANAQTGADARMARPSFRDAFDPDTNRMTEIANQRMRQQQHAMKLLSETVIEGARNVKHASGHHS